MVRSGVPRKSALCPHSAVKWPHWVRYTMNSLSNGGLPKNRTVQTGGQNRVDVDDHSGKLGAKWSRKVHFLRGFYAVFNLPALYDFPVTPQY